MGIAWIGQIILGNFYLPVLSYIVSAFITCQGVIVFILLVPLSKQVCVLCMYTIVGSYIDFLLRR